jgi:uncharacterized protein (TIGR02271 family)
MTDLSTLRSWVGRKVVDQDGVKIGRVDEIYLDDETGQPEWITVHTGMIGARTNFVPLRGAHMAGEDVQVPYDKQLVKDAPNIEPGGHLEPREEERLYEHYSLAGAGAAREPQGRQARQPTEEARATRGEAGGEAAMAGGAAGTMAGTQAGRQPGAEAGGPGMAGRTAEEQAAASQAQAAERAQAGQPAQAAGPARVEGEGEVELAMTRSEEELRIGKEEIETGRARLHKYVVTEEVQTTVPLRHEEVRVEREPISERDRQSFGDLTIAEEEREIILHEERPVIGKETVAKERIRLGKESVTEERAVREQVRKERIEVEGAEQMTAEQLRDRRDPRQGRQA